MKTVALHRWFFFLGQLYGKDCSTGQSFCSKPGQIDDVWSDTSGNLYVSIFYGQVQTQGGYNAVEVHLAKSQRASETEREASIINLIGGQVVSTPKGTTPSDKKDTCDAELSH